MQRIDTIHYQESADAHNRFAKVTLDATVDDTWTISLNGTDNNGDYVVPHFVAIDNYNNNGSVDITIDAIEATIGPFTKQIWGLSSFAKDIVLGITEGVVTIWISEQKLPIGEGVNQFGQDMALQSVTRVNSKAALQAIASPTADMVCYLSQEPYHGIFIYRVGDFSALVAVDTQSAIYIPSAADPVGSTGCWVRELNGPYYAAWFGVSESIADNAVAINAANAYVNAIGGGTLIYPSGIISHSGVIFKNKVHHRGFGFDQFALGGTVLRYTGNGDGVQVNNPINSATWGGYTCSDITFENVNINAGKGCFADLASQFVNFTRCFFLGSDRGLILDQTEICEIKNCYCMGQKTSCLWLVDGDRTAGTFTQATNNIHIIDCNFYPNPTGWCIVDDGGVDHKITNCNYNGGYGHIRFSNVVQCGIYGGEFEGAVNENIRFAAESLAGTAKAPNITCTIADCQISCQNGAANYGIYTEFAGLQSLFLNNNLFSGGGGVPANVYQTWTIGNVVSIGNRSANGTLFDNYGANFHAALDSVKSGTIGTKFGLSVVGQQVVGPRGASLPADASDLATVIALANAIKARIKTTGGHGLVAD